MRRGSTHVCAREVKLAESCRPRGPAIIGLSLLGLIVGASLAAPIIAPQDIGDPAALDLWNSELPPVWQEGGSWPWVLGTDLHGRDLLSALLHGSRLSIGIAFAATLLSTLIGLALGLLAGMRGGWCELIVQFLGDVALAVPSLFCAAIVAALLRGGTGGGVLTMEAAALVIVFAIASNGWVGPAHASSARVRVECARDHVLAARLARVAPWRILLLHILPNCLGPVLVTATLGFGMAILTEATLSFLGIGLSADQPSLGTLIRLGHDDLFSGAWWLVVFPVLLLTVLVISVNLIGDWLATLLDPRVGAGKR